MMSTIKNSNGNRYKIYKQYEHRLHSPYDYETNGLLNRILSNKIYNTTNPILKYILSVYEQSIIYLLKYVDILENFFNYNKFNR